MVGTIFFLGKLDYKQLMYAVVGNLQEGQGEMAVLWLLGNGL